MMVPIEDTIYFPWSCQVFNNSLAPMTLKWPSGYPPDWSNYPGAFLPDWGIRGCGVVSPVIHGQGGEVHLVFALEGVIPWGDIEQWQGAKRTADGHQGQRRLLSFQALTMQQFGLARNLQRLQTNTHLFNK